jgi:uncharacterized protein (TIGR02246 family)
MKLLACMFLLLPMFGVVPAAWAGPAEEIAELRRQAGQALAEGNVDAFVANFADNAIVTAFWAPFRVEGKAAIKGHFDTFVKIYPTRQALGRHALTRVYGNDTTVVSNGYEILYLTDRSGKFTEHHIRTSQTWVKVGADWKIVDQHVSRVPTP